jgi:hypothetical protein
VVWQGYAGIFNGPVAINGPLTVYGQYFKSAAVPHPDGSHRRLYCLEAPESLFEDFGRARLVAGRAEVQLEPDFAALIHTDDYHVFLTAEAPSAGLYIAERFADRFLVRENGGAHSGTPFSYRVVAKRKDVHAVRLERVTPPRPTAREVTVPPVLPPDKSPSLPEHKPR